MSDFSPIVTLFLSIPYYFVLLTEVAVCSLQLRRGDLGSYSSQAEYLQKLFGILLHERLVSFPPLICLCNHLFTSVWACGYLFSTLGISQDYLICRSNVLAIRSSFSWLLCPFDIIAIMVRVFLFFAFVFISFFVLFLFLLPPSLPPIPTHP